MLQILRQPLEHALGRARRFREQALVRRLGARQVAERRLRRGNVAGLEEHADPVPHIGDRQAAAAVERVGKRMTAVGQLLRVQPEGGGFAQRGIVAAREARVQSVAAHFQIGPRHRGELVLEFPPRRAPAEHLDPLEAKQLRGIGVAVLGEEFGDVGARRVLEAQRNAPVFQPGREQMPVQLLRVARELHRVAGAPGVVCCERGLVVLRGADRRCRRDDYGACGEILK
jgi:hypothetical protein